jgi:hypothetical protein
VPQGSNRVKLPDQELCAERINRAAAAVLMIANPIVRNEPSSIMIRHTELNTELQRIISSRP